MLFQSVLIGLSVLRLTNLWPSDSGSNWNLKMLIFEVRGKLEQPEKNLSEQEITDNKLNPHMMLGPVIKPGPHWWEASALTTAPPLLPQILKFGYLVYHLFCLQLILDVK